MLNIPTDKIRDLIGPGGKKIRSIIEATGVKIDVMDDGKVHVFADNGKAAEEALKMIRDVTATAEIGKTYLGKVVRIAEFGAFVEIFPGTDGLLHISEIADTAHPRRARRAEGRRPGAGEGPGHRGQQDSPEPQSRAARAARQAAEERSHKLASFFRQIDPKKGRPNRPPFFYAYAEPLLTEEKSNARSSTPKCRALAKALGKGAQVKATGRRRRCLQHRR